MANTNRDVARDALSWLIEVGDDVTREVVDEIIEVIFDAIDYHSDPQHIRAWLKSRGVAFADDGSIA